MHYDTTRYTYVLRPYGDDTTNTGSAIQRPSLSTVYTTRTGLYRVYMYRLLSFVLACFYIDYVGHINLRTLPPPHLRTRWLPDNQSGFTTDVRSLPLMIRLSASRIASIDCRDRVASSEGSLSRQLPSVGLSDLPRPAVVTNPVEDDGERQGAIGGREGG